MESDIEKTVRELADRQAISDCLLRYCRGVDRLDAELMLSAYHPDAVDDHGYVVLGAKGFVDWAQNYHREHQIAHHHVITNSSVDLQGDVAHAETYYLFICKNREAPDTLSFGRYIDRLEKRDGRWAIARRVCVTEAINHLLPSERRTAAPPHLVDRSPADISYARPLGVGVPC